MSHTFSFDLFTCFWITLANNPPFELAPLSAMINQTQPTEQGELG